ncbi:geranylgeranyl transferase type2 beta subunit, putative [Plasmodium berghei]|uniref:Geranylgeranyl transferase type II subunit beta n=2 Tax=Plasmodium berghei TaxID=5821 RepID=A0A509AUI0_PLABA|nr:geranylgeranyl transferase type-2 subunit beta, putative [Plasmodium berghei ANKA]CXJ19326.1 geranylgeranyl transferase type2 beta subunit, putative [Plasmodium berghei]SCM26480.1 geranylgeranyl transferase type2 beta subunit, putative [Plasmodium berghei]SCN28479.1 geranylgeranyl transferase type2 beta subunit, putative [Plasmodium berghei]SCO62669.1 geranylgeranyl transferase type2 beta subunit, putative [Plasmodium berghei]SCO64230.1 geranylgeranyl transferase type2 beta subunit, putativ|eukprot:XP_034424125.1 geranylgeranyl transferase type-2 subunit beta, putative [Plasmodium berghei ANKA]
MELNIKLHEEYFLKSIKEKLESKSKRDHVSDKYESILINGVFWVLSGILIMNKGKNSLSDILEKNIIDMLYLLVMQSLQKKKIKEDIIYNYKKKNKILSDKDINEVMKIVKQKYYDDVINIKIDNEGTSISVENISHYNDKTYENINRIEFPKNEGQKINITFNTNENITNDLLINNMREIDKVEKKDLNLSQNSTHLCGLKSNKKMKKKFIVCGFSPCNKKLLYESNVISTLSAIQILFLINRTSENDISTKTLLEIYNFINLMFDEDKGFYHFSLKSFLLHFDGDMRFVFCSLSSLYFINLLLSKRNIYIYINNNTQKCINWILNCFNVDGGFSKFPGSESHAGTTFCAVNSLNLLKDNNNRSCLFTNKWIRSKLIRWLCDRYENQGINGRVSKNHDVCYSWWVLSSLVSLKCNLSKLLNVNILINFILKCQDKDNGGFSRVQQNNNYIKKSENFNYYDKEDISYKQSDLFHSFFAISALSIIYYNIQYYKNKKSDKYDIFGDIKIPKHLEDQLIQLNDVHSSFAMPVYMTI